MVGTPFHGTNRELPKDNPTSRLLCRVSAVLRGFIVHVRPLERPGTGAERPNLCQTCQPVSRSRAQDNAPAPISCRPKRPGTATAISRVQPTGQAQDRLSGLSAPTCG